LGVRLSKFCRFGITAEGSRRALMRVIGRERKTVGRLHRRRLKSCEFGDLILNNSGEFDHVRVCFCAQRTVTVKNICHGLASLRS